MGLPQLLCKFFECLNCYRDITAPCSRSCLSVASSFLRGLYSIYQDILQCHTSDHYLATSVPPGGRSSSMFPCQVVIVLVLWGVRPLRSPGSKSLIVCSVRSSQSDDISKNFHSVQSQCVTTHNTLGIIPDPYITFITIIATIMSYAHYVHKFLWLSSASKYSSFPIISIITIIVAMTIFWSLSDHSGGQSL